MMSASTKHYHLLRSLCKANQAILSQKLALLDVLTSNNGADGAAVLFSKVCPIAGASVGQHYRHSMDHLELAALVAASTPASSSIFTSPITASITPMDERKQNIPSRILPHSPSPVTLHYDKRVRGGTLETDVDMTRSRIQSIWSTLQDICDDNDRLGKRHLDGRLEEEDSIDHFEVGNYPVKASFLLSSDTANDKDGSVNEIELSSTIGRELGFAAHHAIHHMAMVKIIVVETIGLDVKELPPDFGRAPSTVQHDNNKTSLEMNGCIDLTTTA